MTERHPTEQRLEDVPDYGRDVVHYRIHGRILPLCGYANLEPTRGPGPRRGEPTERCPICRAAAGGQR